MMGAIAHARNADPDTSHEAAASVSKGMVQGERNLVVSMLSKFGPVLSDGEIALWAIGECCNVCSEQGLRSRRCELMRDGYVEVAGYGETDSGRRCRLYRLTKKGEEYAASLS